MRIHILQHVPFEGPASIEAWAGSRGADITVSNFFEFGWHLPDPHSLKLLVVMGGPMGVHDEATNPWMPEEKQFIRACIDAKVKILGVCLGAQLCAEALGAKVYPSKQKEIGWFPIRKVAEHPVVALLPDSQTVFHWHGDTFDLPQGATLLASSEACTNQMFIWNDQVLAIQCHLEMERQHIEALAAHCGSYLDVHVPTVSTLPEIRAGYANTEVTPLLLNAMLDFFVG